MKRIVRRWITQPQPQVQFEGAGNTGSVPGTSLVADTVSSPPQVQSEESRSTEPAPGTSSEDLSEPILYHRSKCIECKETLEPPRLSLVNCKQCFQWQHIKCSEFDDCTLQERVLEFFCKPCREEHGLIVLWHQDASEEAVAIKTAGDYWRIDKISDFKKYKNGKRQFLVHWTSDETGSYEPSWLPENRLDGCLDTLQAFCLEKKIPLSTIEGKVGASSSSQTANYDGRNWVTIGKIKRWINAYRNLATYRTNLPVIEYKGSTTDEDAVFLVPYEDHVYVALYFNEHKFALIADGANFIFDSLSKKKELKEYLNIDIMACHWDQVWHVDYCGSSAASIALEFMHSYKSQRYSIYQRGKRWIKDKIITVMHKYKSEAIRQSKGSLAKKRNSVFCRYCNREFKSNKLSSVNLHEISRCPKRPNQ
jgi:hypothetical protein